MTLRDRFEARYPCPGGTTWTGDEYRMTGDVTPDNLMAFMEHCARWEAYQAAMEDQWRDPAERPEYGEPIIVKIKGVTQHVTYMLDGANETPDWIEPYHFVHDDNCKAWWLDVTAWMYLPDAAWAT